MYAITIGMLVRQPVMFSSIVLIKWIPGFTLFLPERDMQKSTCSNTHTHTDVHTTQADLGSVYRNRQLREVRMD